jgi:GNAT superfamily N-acetyltransferase
VATPGLTRGSRVGALSFAQAPPTPDPSPPRASRAGGGEPTGRAGHFVRAAESDADVVAIHRFLCTVARPVLHCPINGEKSIAEVWRVVKQGDYGFALIALEDGELVGTLGAIFVPWWYGDDHFFTDRWFFTLPGHRWAGPRLLAEGDAIARQVGVPLIVNLKQRRTTAAVTFVKPLLLGERRTANRS